MKIDEHAVQMARAIWRLSQTEPEYQKMLAEARSLENEYEDAVTQLPHKQEIAVRDFLSHCEAMSWRMLQIACAVIQSIGNQDT